MDGLSGLDSLEKFLFRQLETEVGHLRDHFFDEFKGSICDGKSYDKRDIDKIQKDDRLLLCYLRAYSVRQDLEEPSKQLDFVLKWRKTFGILDITDHSLPSVLFERQYLYWKGVDKNGHKILILKVAKHEKKTLKEEAMKHIAYIFEKHHSENPGERIVFVFDFTGAGVTNVDLDVVKFIISALSNYFPCLLAYILLHEMPFLLSAVWRVIRSWLSEEQKEMIILVKKNDIGQYINSDQLEEHMLKK